MDSDVIAIGLLAILIALGACIGIGVISSSAWNAIGMAVPLMLLLAFIFYLVFLNDADPGVDGLAQALGIALIVETLKYLLPAAAFVAAVASIISNGGRLRRAPKDKA